MALTQFDERFYLLSALLRVTFSSGSVMRFWRGNSSASLIIFLGGSSRSADKKWKEIPRELKNDGLIPNTPALGQARYWADFKTLVKYRHGLVHARSSRPETEGQPDGEEPLPSLNILNEKQPGWATRIVVELARDLNKAAGTQPPTWLVDP